MIVVDIQYNAFSEVNHLNQNFIPGVNKLKLTIDAISSTKVYQDTYHIIAAQCSQLFPNLRNHLCCYEKLDKELTNHNHENKESHDYVTDIIHLIEHVIIDVQCSISKMKICSGITCNYYEPRNRYDIFVECIDEQVGYYAAQLAIELICRILNSDRFIINYAFPEQTKSIFETSFNTVPFDYDFPSYITNYVFNDLHLKKN